MNIPSNHFPACSNFSKHRRDSQYFKKQTTLLFPPMWYVHNKSCHPLQQQKHGELSTDTILKVIATQNTT